MILQVRLHLPAEAAFVPLVRRQVALILQHQCVVEADMHRASVIATEACSNVVLHAYDEPGHCFTVEIHYHWDRFLIRVADAGRGFDPSDVPDPLPGQIGGYGLYFIKQVADSYSVTTLPTSGSLLTAEILLRYCSDESRDQARSLDAALANPSLLPPM